MIPLLGHAWPLAIAVLVAAVSYGSFWAPGMSLLADRAEAMGLEHAYAFALVTMAWAPGAAGGAAFGGALADATADWVPYFALAGACVVTLVAIRPATQSSVQDNSVPGGPGAAIARTQGDPVAASVLQGQTPKKGFTSSRCPSMVTDTCARVGARTAPILSRTEA